MSSKDEVAKALAIAARRPNANGRPLRVPPNVTTFECVHQWKLAPGRDTDSTTGITAAGEGFLFCKKCFGYWHPLVGWTRDPRRVKKMMRDDGVPRQ
ncbi:MAG: hypothetical protein JRN68_06075 [Nitrososphaerota archaeon]|nr:hypothetical protein [Nitrososphaerota archaeon]